MSFVIEFPAGLTKKVRGIYRLNFGERYYIGRSICIHSRLINHQKNINNLLERTRIPSRFDYYRNIIKWIRFNKMETAQATILLLCPDHTPYELDGDEDFYIRFYNQFGDCLNSTQLQYPFQKIEPCLPNLTSLEGTTGPDPQ